MPVASIQSCDHITAERRVMSTEVQRQMAVGSFEMGKYRQSGDNLNIRGRIPFQEMIICHLSLMLTAGRHYVKIGR